MEQSWSDRNMFCCHCQSSSKSQLPVVNESLAQQVPGNEPDLSTGPEDEDEQRVKLHDENKSLFNRTVLLKFHKVPRSL